MVKKYKMICDKLKINYKSEMFLCIGLLFLSLIMMVILSVLVSFFVGVFVLLVYVAILYFHLSNINRKYMLLLLRKQMAFEIVYLHLINYFKVNYTLINALKICEEKCDEILREDINELILNINDDKSLEPFLKFSDNFVDQNVKNKVLYLHSLLFLKETSKYVCTLQSYCLEENNNSNYLHEYQSKEIEKFKLVPLILSIVSILIIFSYVFSSIGEIIHG